MRFDIFNATPIPDDQYRIAGTENIKEALGFLKDWVTSVLQIETAVLGAIGAATVLKNEPDIRLSHWQLVSVALASVFFGISILCGTMILNMLPGAVQRAPQGAEAEKNDIYSIYTASKMRIYDWTGWFRLTFQLGIACIPVFIVTRALRL